MGIPERREDLTIAWFNSIFNVKGIKVHDVIFTGETKQGQGFMGTLEQVELKISKYNSNGTAADESTTTDYTETLHIILKTLPKDPFRRSYAANDGFSSREVSMYMDVFPIWDKFMDDRHVPESSRFRYPICYYGAEEGEGDSYKYILVLEHLTLPQSNFMLWTAGFTQPLPWFEAAKVIRQIARFHATGIAYKMESHIDSYYKLFPKLKHFVSPVFQSMWDQGFAVAKEVIRSVVDEKDIPKGLFEQLDELHGEVSRDILLKWFTDTTMVSYFGNTSTICHHDLHSQNLVLSKDSHAVLFDYQVCCVFNPMKDLTFFLILNCETEDITVNLMRALQLYHDEFEKTMKAINIDFKYSMENIVKDYNLYFAFSLVHIMTGAPIWITGQKSNPMSKRRFAVAVLDAFKKGILRFPDPDLMNKK